MIVSPRRRILALCLVCTLTVTLSWSTAAAAAPDTYQQILLEVAKDATKGAVKGGAAGAAEEALKSSVSELAELYIDGSPVVLRSFDNILTCTYKSVQLSIETVQAWAKSDKQRGSKRSESELTAFEKSNLSLINSALASYQRFLDNIWSYPMVSARRSAKNKIAALNRYKQKLPDLHKIYQEAWDGKK